MATVPVHGRLRVGGSLYNDARWSIGLNFLDSLANDPFAEGNSDVQGILQQWADNVKGLNGGAVFPVNLLGLLSRAGTVDTVRTSRVGTDGKETAVAQILLGTPAKGTTDPLHTAQSALVFSLQTGRPGASYRGRVYFPALGTPLSNGRYDVGICATWAGEMASWINSCGDALVNLAGINGQAVVLSTRLGHGQLVREVRVGNRLDTQRRRAESQDEVYSTAVVPN